MFIDFTHQSKDGPHGKDKGPTRNDQFLAKKMPPTDNSAKPLYIEGPYQKYRIGLTVFDR
jgi:hypothetical protein